MMKAAAGRGVDLGRIVEIAEAIAPEVLVFDASLGVDDKCLSAEKLVQLLHQGVHGEDGRADFIKLTFAEGHLAARVQEAIRSHQNVVDTVRIDGNFRQKGKKQLVGQARIEFANSADLLNG